MYYPKTNLRVNGNICQQFGSTIREMNTHIHSPFVIRLLQYFSFLDRKLTEPPSSLAERSLDQSRKKEEHT